MSGEMSNTEFLFRVGMALGRAIAPPRQPVSTIPTLAPGQRTVQMWSEPDALGYRYLLTFDLAATPTPTTEDPHSVAETPEDNR